MSDDPQPPTEEEMAQAEAQYQALMREIAEGKSSFPEPMSKESEYRFVRSIVDENDVSKMRKLGYLTKPEIGHPKVPLRVWEGMNVFNAQMGLLQVAQYLGVRGMVLPATGLSEKGFLVSVPGTVKKKSIIGGPKKETHKSSFFGGDTVVREGGDVD